MLKRRRTAWLVIPVEGGHALVPDLTLRTERQRPALSWHRSPPRVRAHDLPQAVEERARVNASLAELLAAGPPPPPPRIVGYPGRPGQEPQAREVEPEQLAGGRGCGVLVWDEPRGGG